MSVHPTEWPAYAHTCFQLPPREEYVQIGTIPNWSPVVDLVTTDTHSTWDLSDPKVDIRANSARRIAKSQVKNSDRVFGTSGRGIKGSVTEFRHGMPAELHLDLDYGTPIKQAWAFPAELCGGNDGVYILLAVPEGSDLLHISGDLSEATKPEDGETSFDTGSRTLAAAPVGDSAIVQVSKDYVTVMSGRQG